eukprot:COSAG06_NODE_66988_length_253_cov_0.655844_1_plen_32_part_01
MEQKAQHARQQAQLGFAVPHTIALLLLSFLEA